MIATDHCRLMWASQSTSVHTALFTRGEFACSCPRRAVRHARGPNTLHGYPLPSSHSSSQHAWTLVTPLDIPICIHSLGVPGRQGAFPRTSCSLSGFVRDGAWDCPKVELSGVYGHSAIELRAIDSKFFRLLSPCLASSGQRPYLLLMCTAVASGHPSPFIICRPSISHSMLTWCGICDVGCGTWTLDSKAHVPCYRAITTDCTRYRESRSLIDNVCTALPPNGFLPPKSSCRLPVQQ